MFNFFKSSPRELIVAGNIEELKHRLSTGKLSPDYCESETYPILYFAIVQRQPEIVTLLLKYGANPNIATIIAGTTDRFVIRASYYGRHTPALMKLLLTYGAEYEHIRQQRLSLFPAFGVDPHIIWLDSIKKKCYSLYDLLKTGQQYFEEESFFNAREQFSQAVSLLDEFIAEEISGQEDSSYKSEPAYLEGYRYRAEQCRLKIAECDKRTLDSQSEPLELSSNEVSSEEGSSDVVPLLDSSPRSYLGLRRRR
jgi:hypothetical protein